MTSAEPDRATEVVRALALSWFAVSLAALAHLAAGGTAPGVASCLAVGAFLTIVSMPLCRNAFRLTRHGPLLLVQQLVTHAVLSLTSPGHGAPVRPTAQLAGALGNGHAIHPAAGNRQHVAASSHAVESGHALMPSPTMVVAHLCAAVLVAALLTRAESGWAGVRALQHGHARAIPRFAALVTQLASVPVAFDLAALLRRLPRPGDSGSAPPPAMLDLWRSPAPCRRGPPRPCAA
ncbi:hypothetical protein V6K52_17890 [Knoellia sp. S7-12]|uniref:hypothetical protein n=1 Tax=Knoellia sp. S7-12 TaxID=3126698 RepID=UPI0033683E7B